MAHDRDDRRARLLIGFDIGITDNANFNVRIRDTADVVAEFGDQKLCGVLIDRLVDGDGHAHLEQRLHQIRAALGRSEEHTSELQSLMRISYAVFCLKKKKIKTVRSYTTIKTPHHT